MTTQIIAMHLPGAAILLAVALWIAASVREHRRNMRLLRHQLTLIRLDVNRLEQMASEAEDTLRSAREEGEL